MTAQETTGDSPLTAEQVGDRLAEIAPWPGADGTAEDLARWFAVRAQAARVRALLPFAAPEVMAGLAAGYLAAARAFRALMAVPHIGQSAAKDVVAALGGGDEGDVLGARLLAELEALGIDPDEVTRLAELGAASGQQDSAERRLAEVIAYCRDESGRAGFQGDPAGVIAIAEGRGTARYPSAAVLVRYMRSAGWELWRSSHGHQAYKGPGGYLTAVPGSDGDQDEMWGAVHCIAQAEKRSVPEVLAAILAASEPVDLGYLSLPGDIHSELEAGDGR